MVEVSNLTPLRSHCFHLAQRERADSSIRCAKARLRHCDEIHHAQENPTDDCGDDPFHASDS